VAETLGAHASNLAIAAGSLPQPAKTQPAKNRHHYTPKPPKRAEPLRPITRGDAEARIGRSERTQANGAIKRPSNRCYAVAPPNALNRDQLYRCPSPRPASGSFFRHEKPDILVRFQMNVPARHTPSDCDGNFHLEADQDIGLFVTEKIRRLAGVKDTYTLITFNAFGGATA